IITLMDEGTELAIGIHAANNIVAAVLVTSDWMVFQTDALYKDISEPNITAETLFPVLVIYPILLLIFAKKYQWNQWTERLFGTIDDAI
ncbi:MAG: CPBP family intramembrane glutamate endopeptidase, partial [Flavobacteriaceae bacterium]|nr:CPBP family intramembrane glutamate endopeptidase [Flavobacteriaceae bacterium]